MMLKWKKKTIAYKSLGNKVTYVNSGVCKRYHKSFVYRFFLYLFYEFLMFAYTLNLIWNGSGDDYLY